jgi:hypothetical protein
MNGVEPEPDVEIGCILRFGSKSDRMENAVSSVEQMAYESGAHARATIRTPDIEMPQPTNPLMTCVWIAVEATNRDQFGRLEGTKEHLA